MRTKAVNEAVLTFPSQSRNESFARSAAACFEIGRASCRERV